MNYKRDHLKDKIEIVLKDWRNDVQKLTWLKGIVAINFGSQKTLSGYEIYLSGHTWFDGHDLWLLDEEWNPERNYNSIGKESLDLDRLEILELWEKLVTFEVSQNSTSYKNLIVTVGLIDSDYKRIK